jgi:hypothetical protein
LNTREGRSILPGVSAVALGLLALAIAVVELFVSLRIDAPAGGGNQGAGLGLGTTAYVAGYAGAGIILIAVGIWKIFRS